MNNTKIRILSFLPSLSIMILIFFFSSQPADDSSSLSESFTYNIVKTFHSFIDSDVTEETLLIQTEQIHGIIRKAAHMTEYFLLALSLSFFFYINGFSFQKRFLYSILICVIYASSDEVHQFFVPGRSCQLSDVFIDSSGCLLSFFIQRIICKIIFFLNKNAH